jgi:FKBP-type peptidyl-prolyl cis-trans isomerase FkpA
MKYLLFFFSFIIAFNVKAQSDFQHLPDGVLYHIYTQNTGDKIKIDDIVTFNFIEKTDKDSILKSTYTDMRPGQIRVAAPQNIMDLLEVFPLVTVNDSILVKVPTDSVFKGMEDKRPPFFPKGTYLNIILKILKIQSLTEVMATMKAAELEAKNKEQEIRTKYITDHKLILNTTASGLKYVVTKPSLKPKPQNGDTVYVNYTGRSVDDKVFDTSIADIAKSAGTYTDGRPYEPYPVVVGTHGVIAGWDEALLLLNEGAKATLVIPSNLAYGSGGQGAIKPYSTLIFDIELTKVKRTKHAPVAPAKKPLAKKTVKKKATK